MKRFNHWTPRYIYNRIMLGLYQKRHPDHPWLTGQAISIMSSYLKDSDVGMEFGSGRSTFWIAQRVKKLTSVEHNKLWYNKLKNKLDERRIHNVDIKLCEIEKSETVSKNSQKYIQVLGNFKNNSLDFVLVDGKYRDLCSLVAIDKVRPGGVIIIDNVERYLPSNSYSPFSRTFADGPITCKWEEFLSAIKEWRYIWTSNGIFDTAFYFKPLFFD